MAVVRPMCSRRALLLFPGHRPAGDRWGAQVLCQRTYSRLLSAAGVSAMAAPGLASASMATPRRSLGLCLFRGIGCDRDVIEAAKWYTLAAEQKNLSAMNDLAFCKMHGIGVDQDREGAFALALEAAKSGHAPAQTFVGECYLDGRGVERDVAAGETWLYRAARLGNARAKRLLETR